MQLVDKDSFLFLINHYLFTYSQNVNVDKYASNFSIGGISPQSFTSLASEALSPVFSS